MATIIKAYTATNASEDEITVFASTPGLAKTFAAEAFAVPYIEVRVKRDPDMDHLGREYGILGVLDYDWQCRIEADREADRAEWLAEMARDRALFGEWE